MNRTLLSLLTPLLLFFALILFALQVLLPQASAENTAPELTWAWRKNFKNAELHNLAAAWNGSLFAVAVTDRSPAKNKGEVIIGVDADSKVIKDWKIGKKVRNLALDGGGSLLFAELEDGTFHIYDHWKTKTQPMTLPVKVREAIVSPKSGLIVASVVNNDGTSSLRAFSGKAKQLWKYESVPADGWMGMFPFAEKDKTVLLASKTGKITLFEDAKPLWSIDTGGGLSSLSSSFLQGSLIAAASAGDKGSVRFFDDKGTQTAMSGLPSERISLSCADAGEACAALTINKTDRELRFLSPQGKELWKARFPAATLATSAVVAADHARIVITAVEQQGKESLRAWDAKGKVLWNAPIEGGIKEWKTSWNGKKIIVVTKDSRLVFFNLEPRKTSAPGAGK